MRTVTLQGGVELNLSSPSLNLSQEDKKARFQELLKDNPVVVVIFKKVSTGEYRRLIAGHKPVDLDEFGNPVKHVAKRKSPEDSLVMWDSENEGWRSCKIEHIVSVELPE